MVKSSKNKKLAFMYLANDVIKNCPEFIAEYAIYMKEVFRHLVTLNLNEKVIGNIGELIQTWREAEIFDEKIQFALERIWKEGSVDGTIVGKDLKEKVCLTELPPAHLTCSVCADLLDDPVQLPCCKTALCKFCAFSRLEKHNGCWFGFCSKSVLLCKEDINTSLELSIQVDLWKKLSKESGDLTNIKVERNVERKNHNSLKNEYVEPDEKEIVTIEESFKGKEDLLIRKAENMEQNSSQSLSFDQHAISLGLPQKIPKGVIKIYFEKFGEVPKVQLKKESNCAELWGSAIIRFSEKAVVDKVLLQKHLIGDHWCYARRASNSELEDLTTEDDNNDKTIYVGQVNIEDSRKRSADKVDEPFLLWTVQYDKPLPATLVARCKTNICGICSVTLSSLVDSKAHYDGKNHDKKVRHELLKMFKDTGEIPPKRKKLEGIAAANDFLESLSDKSCRVCNVEISSAAMAKLHYSGRQHRNKAAASHDDGNNLFCSVCMVQCSSAVVYESHVAGKLHEKKLAAHGHRVIKHKINSNAIQCEVCNIYVSSEDTLNAHKAGGKHRKKLEMKRKEQEFLLRSVRYHGDGQGELGDAFTGGQTQGKGR